MNLTDRAQAKGINKYSAYRWFKEGTLPVPAVRVNSRSILVPVPRPAVATRVGPSTPGSPRTTRGTIWLAN
jgi:putative resolvase